MSKRLPVVTGKQLLNVLHSAGWNIHHVRGSHHQLKHIVSGKKITIPIHAGHEIKRGLLKAILNDIGLSIEKFRTLL